MVPIADADDDADDRQQWTQDRQEYMVPKHEADGAGRISGCCRIHCKPSFRLLKVQLRTSNTPYHRFRNPLLCSAVYFCTYGRSPMKRARLTAASTWRCCLAVRLVLVRLMT